MLTGDKIKLRPIVKEDITYLNKWKNDYDVFKNLGGGYLPISIDQQAKWMDNMIDNTGNSKRFIIQRDDSTPIGFIGLYDIHSIHRYAELGMYIGEKKEWGNGYAKDATRVILNFAFTVLNLRKVKLQLVTSNKSAYKLYEGLGFVNVGKYKEDRYIEGNYEDVTLMELFKRQFINR